MIFTVAPAVTTSPLWANFRYLEEILSDLHNFPQHLAMEYVVRIQAINLDHLQGTYPRRDEIIPFHIHHTRFRFYQLLLQIMSIEKINSIYQITVTGIRQYPGQPKYDIEIQFSNEQHMWPVLFYFDHRCLLKEISKHYQYQKLSSMPTMPAGSFSSSRRRVVYKPKAPSAPIPVTSFTVSEGPALPSVPLSTLPDMTTLNLAPSPPTPSSPQPMPRRQVVYRPKLY